MEAGIADRERIPIDRQWLGNHVSEVTNNHATAGIVGSSVFCVVRAKAW
jgi:hypothetical protein